MSFSFRGWSEASTDFISRPDPRADWKPYSLGARIIEEC